MSDIRKKLLAIQGELKAPKGQRNTFGNYNYRSAEDILEAVKPLCVKHNAIVNLSDEVVLIGERYYVKAHATLKDTDTDEYEETYAYAREEENKKGMDGSQITGTASSYARKYAMNGLFAIDDQKDADTDEHKKQVDQVKEVKATKEQITQIKGLFSETQIPALLKRANVKALEELTVVQASDYIKKMQSAQQQ